MSLNFKYRIDFRIGVKNLLTLAGLSTLFGVVRHSVTNLLTLAGLWTLFGYTSVSAHWRVPYAVEENLRGMNERMKERQKDKVLGFLILEAKLSINMQTMIISEKCP